MARDENAAIKARLKGLGVPPEDGADFAADQVNSERERQGKCMDTLAENGIRFVDAVDFVENPPPEFDWLVPGFIARGMKGDIFGKAKTRKSFFVMQLAQCLAGGRKFLCWDIPRPVTVVYFNLELMERGAWERMKAQEDKLQLKLERGRLMVCNLRSNPRALREDCELLAGALKRLNADIAIIDPRYKLEQDGEDTNTAAGMRGLLDFRDKLLASGCAVLVVGHDPKGDTAGKAITDRGAGSYTAGADYDFCLTLSPHKQEGYTVLSASSRYRAAPPDMSVLWQPRAQIFELVESMPAEVPNPRGGKPRIVTRDARRELARKAAEIVKGHEAVCTKTELVNEVYQRLHEEEGVSQKDALAVVETMLGNYADAQGLREDLGIVHFKRDFPKGEFVGTPEQMERFKNEPPVTPSRRRRR